MIRPSPVLLLGLALSACAVEPTPAPAPRALKALHDVVDRPMTREGERELRPYYVDIVAPPSPCAVEGHTPRVIACRSLAVVGDEFGITWAAEPPHEPWTYPTPASAALLVGFSYVEPARIPNGAGCYLMVRPDLVMPAKDGTPFTMSNGHFILRLVLPPSVLGVKCWVQVVASDARSPRGVVTSDMAVFEVLPADTVSKRLVPLEGPSG